MKEERFSISIKGKSYVFLSSESERILLRAAQLVDKKTEEIEALSPSINSLNSLSVAAFIFAVDCLRFEDENKELKKQLQKIQTKLNEAKAGQASFLDFAAPITVKDENNIEPPPKKTAKRLTNK